MDPDEHSNTYLVVIVKMWMEIYNDDEKKNDHNMAFNSLKHYAKFTYNRLPDEIKQQLNVILLGGG